MVRSMYPRWCGGVLSAEGTEEEEREEDRSPALRERRPPLQLTARAIGGTTWRSEPSAPGSGAGRTAARRRATEPLMFAGTNGPVRVQVVAVRVGGGRRSR
jgi:hypothetical protein